MILGLAACSSQPKDAAFETDLVLVPEIGDVTPKVANTSASDKNPRIIAPTEPSFNLWWRYTGNKELETLIDRAITNSQVLQIDAQRVLQAKARYLQAGAEGMPSITAEASYSKEVPSNIGTVPRGQRPKGKGEYQIGLAGSYTLDLWGQRQSLRDSAEFRLKQAIFQYDAQLLDLITNLAKSYFEYLSLNDRVANAKETEIALESMLLAMEDRYRMGDASLIEVEIQRSAILSSRTQLPSLLKERQQLHYRIAALISIAPESLQLSNLGLASVALPEAIEGISTAHLLRRPDIRTVESGMLAANADLDVARKALLPGLTLVGDLGTGAHKPADLFLPNTLVWNALATLSASVFDGGLKKQEVKFAQAARNELVEVYVNTVYNGLNTARAAITEVEFSGERLNLQTQSNKASRQAQNLGFESYQAGGLDFLTLLDSIEAHQNREDTFYQVELEYYQAFADLYAALGGGIPYREVNNLNPVYQEAFSEEGPFLPSSEQLGFVAQTNKDQPRTSGWLKKSKSFTSKYWLVKLSGVYDKFAIESLIYDLPRRYKNLEPAKVMLIENLDAGITTPNNTASWYSAIFTGFTHQEAAVNWCQMLRNTQQRCVVYQPKHKIEYVGVFRINDLVQLEKELAKAAPKPAAKKGLEPHQLTYRDYIETRKKQELAHNLNLGLIYSLIKTEGNYAWVIHNRSFKLTRVKVGSKLEQGLQVTGISANKLQLGYKKQNFVLQPIYQVAGIKKALDGQVFAHINWGQRGEFYYHRVGDRLYGGGIIKNITAQNIQIDWQGRQVSLPISGR